MISTEERLKAFQEENNIYTKGPLSLVCLLYTSDAADEL